jgi:tRNA pseudouridine13 synthase
VQESELKQYSVFDVVLPLPGFDVLYPNHELKNDYSETLRIDGIDIEQMKHKIK